MAQADAAVFLPGILMPAAARYAPLRAALGDQRPTHTKELEIYSADQPPAGYSLQTEVDGLDRFADDNGLARFHLYGHSAGAAIALAYAAEHGERLLSLALDEPATDFTDDDRAVLAAILPADLDTLPVPERMAAFVRSLLRDGVEPPAPPPPSGDPEMAKRPAGMAAFVTAINAHDVDRDALRAFAGPIYYSYGSLSHPRWEDMAARFERDFARCTVERYEEIHHLNTSHQSDPPRVAGALERLWESATPA